MAMRREHAARRFELKSLDEKGTFSGYGSVFGNEDSYSDIVMPGAFARSLKERGLPKMLWQHDRTLPIGVWTSAKEDEHGLFLEGQLALKTQFGADAYELLKMGALDGLSIGFSTKKAEYDDKKGTRKLTDVELYEVSPVTFPANEAARVEAVKAMGMGDAAAMGMAIGKLIGMCEACDACDCRGEMMAGLEGLPTIMGGAADPGGKARDIRSLEAALRDAGLSRAEAKAVLADGFSALRDAAAADESSERDARDTGGDDLIASMRKLAAQLTT